MNFIQFTEKLKKFDPGKIVFVGLGNETRGDDSAGLVFIRNLRKIKTFRSSVFIEAGRNPENYLQKIQNAVPRAVVFIDACDWKGNPGEIKWLNPDEINSISISTHTFSIKMIEHFLSADNKAGFLYLGIQTYSTVPGKGLSNCIKDKFRFFFPENAGMTEQRTDSPLPHSTSSV